MRFVTHCWAEPDLFLCVDEALVTEAVGATFRLCSPEKAPEPILIADQPWEGARPSDGADLQQDPIDGSVLFEAEEGRFHGWYRPHNRHMRRASDPDLGPHGPRSFRVQGSDVCRAVSADGIHWEKPRLGQVLYEGSTANNMVELAHGPVLNDAIGAVVPNYLPELDAALIASIYSNYNDPLYPRGITFATSADGITWSPRFPPPLPLDGDAHVLMWDPRERCYLVTTRSAQQNHVYQRLGRRRKRHIALARSRDLVHWTPMLTILEADDDDPPEAEMYRMEIVPYGHLYLGFVLMFYPDPSWTYGPLDVQLAVSRDLMKWQRVGGRQPFLPRGGEGSWDSAHVLFTANPPHPEGDRLRFWYAGKNTEHWQAGKGGLGTATLRRDGFACWEAGAEGGTVTTAPMRLEWATWPFVNVDASRGEVRVEILDERGAPIRGCSREDALPITGDHLRAMAQFREGRGNFIRHSGRVRFRFHLRDARLYAFKAPNAALA